jgi:hypothetical protein
MSIRSASEDTKVSVTKRSARYLGKVAIRLFERYPDGHKRLDIRQPSSRVAIDCIIMHYAHKSLSYRKEYKDSDNLYWKVQREQEEFNRSDKGV